MIKDRWRHAAGLSVLAAIVLCATSASDALGQTLPASAVSAPIVVGRKEASRLMLSEVIPEYPAVAKMNYIQGMVRIELQVSPEGRVIRAHVIEGHPLLAVSALHAVRRWLYRPFMTRTGPSPFLTTVNMNFTLRSKKLEMLPQQAESDLTRQIKPPEVASRTNDAPDASPLRLRVLVNEQGEVVDAQLLKGSPSRFFEATRAVEHWSFHPAHWGSLPVPWYLDVDVPVSNPHVRTAAAEPGGR